MLQQPQVQPAQARPSELLLVPTSPVSSASSLTISSSEETSDWTFKATTSESRPLNQIMPPVCRIGIEDSSSAARLTVGRIADAAYESLNFKKKSGKVQFYSNEATGFTFRGPVTVESPSGPKSRQSTRKSVDTAITETHSKRVRCPSREKKIRRQSAIDLTLPGERTAQCEEIVFDISREQRPGGNRILSKSRSQMGSREKFYSVEKNYLTSKQSSLEKSAVSLDNPRLCQQNNGNQASFDKTRDSSFAGSSLQTSSCKKLLPKTPTASNRPQFSRSATLEWTFEGPSSHIPSSDWIDSFTRQHGLASSSHQRRTSFINNARSSLDNPRTAIKHRALSKSPSAPTQDLNSRSIKDYGSTNSSFEHHPTDPIPATVETKVLVHHTTTSASSKFLKKQDKCSSSWSRKLQGITGSQFLTTGWTISSKRSPTYPLLSPTRSQSPTSFQTIRNNPPTSIEMTSESDLPDINFRGSELRERMRRTSSETSWITESQSSNTSGDANPVRRRIPITKLHRSPSRSSRLNPECGVKGHLDTVVQVNTSGGTGWLSIARNQHAKIKKCRALGKLYTTVKVEDDDISMLVNDDSNGSNSVG